MSNVNGQGGFVSWMNFPKTCLKPVLLESGLEHNLVWVFSVACDHNKQHLAVRLVIYTN